mmetsp:Transcript_1045/g.1586  ORF Transcript_1045/g.1586 Transcript_1045/m.1586 type:complete len:224 (+) Transcript_1045:114-785(+)|eukprot:CAMPEP_0171462494 /NCGR_PEP_ID=MMETSP0945-20130129/6509_1 /TAXON_ID=109269 /ORGANISM="Vaucheria litorea, Strain CCMP2940" /LENGTH=223 /DNA_ID=CAMNT_0011989031 /DNA_START=65 /DNA_END=736 /DNA_ORIENTATION=+
MELPKDRESIRALVDDEYFDHRTIPALEAHLMTQIQTNTYDFKANKALLKLYQYFPEMTHQPMVLRACLISLMNLPSSDYAALVYLMPERSMKSEPVSDLLRAVDCFERANFADFWESLSQSETLSEYLTAIPDFKPKLRKMVLTMVARTFQSAPRDELAKILGIEDGRLDDFAAKEGKGVVLKIEGDRVLFAKNEFNQIRTKKFKENVDFESVLKVLGNPLA